MKITTRWTNATVKRVVKIEDGPVLPWDNSSTGKKFRVETIVLTYTWQDGVFVLKSDFDVKLSGPVLKKDGSDSRVTADSRPPYTAWRNQEPELDWLRYLVDTHRPLNDFTMTVLNQHPVEDPA